MKKEIYLIECLTNMHVGAGDKEVSLIDSCVQRDIVTNYPVINGSSLKGALRNHFVKQENKSIDKIFGKENTEEPGSISVEGKIKFLTANLVAYPVVGLDNSHNEVYTLCTTKEIKEEFETLTGKKFSEIKQLEPLTKITESKMKDYIDKLPVIARNKLENGLSQNLWYEEVVPRYTKFYFIVLSEDGETLKEFEAEIKKEEWIQIGANASVGYGYCKIGKC